MDEQIHQIADLAGVKVVKNTTLRIVCGWHRRYFNSELVMGEKPGYGITGDTSSICPDCLKKQEEEYAEYQKRKFTDQQMREYYAQATINDIEAGN